MKIKYKRLFAYLIDTILVGLIVSLIISSNALTPVMDKYNDANKRLEQEYQVILEKEEIKDEDLSMIKSIIYDINSFGNIYFAIEIICMIGYFVIFQFFNKGQTIGKKIMKIKVVNKEKEELPLINLFFRELILFGIIFTMINMICIEVIPQSKYYNVYLAINSISILISYIIYFMIIFRKDEKGLHDLITSSEVIEV